MDKAAAKILWTYYHFIGFIKPKIYFTFDHGHVNSDKSTSKSHGPQYDDNFAAEGSRLSKQIRSLVTKR